MTEYQILLIIGVILGLVISSILLCRDLGKDAVWSRRKPVSVSLLLSGCAVLGYFLIVRLFGAQTYRLLAVLGLGTYFISFPWQVRRLGPHVLDAGRPLFNHFAWGILLIILYLLLRLVGWHPLVIEMRWLQPIMLILSGCLIAMSLSRVEFRTKGMCYCYVVKSWRDCTGYRWSTSRPSTLIIEFRRRRWNLGDVWTIPFAPSQKAAVNAALAQCLPNLDEAV